MAVSLYVRRVSGDDLTATSALIVFQNHVYDDGTIEMQLSNRPDFQFCVCPIFSYPAVSGLTVVGLNRASTYWMRARQRHASGVIDDWGPPLSFRTLDGAGVQQTAPANVMISPAIIVVPQKPSRMLLYAGGSAVAGFPVENLAIDAPVGVKTKDGTQANYYMQLSGAPFDTIALLNTNFPESAQIAIYGGNTVEEMLAGTYVNILPPGTPFRASANLPGNRNGFHGLWQFPSQSFTAVLIVVIASTPSNTMYAEHMIVGRNRVTKNHSVDKTETPIPKGTIERTRTGIADRVVGLPMRKVEFEISMMTEAQYELTYSDLMYRENDPVLVVPNSKSGGFLHDRILFGDLKGSRVFNPSTPRYTRGFSIESLV